MMRVRLSVVRARLPALWSGLKAVLGDPAYERYLAHWRCHHAMEGGEPMDRRTFYNAETARRWDGVRRCC